MDAANSSRILPFNSVEVESLRKQLTAFCVLTLFVLAMLLLLHALFAFILGEPSMAVLAVLGISFGVRLLELMWLQSAKSRISLQLAKADGVASIVMVFVLAALLAWLTNHDHSPYQVLLAIPVLQSAFLLGLTATIVSIVVADATIFLWLWHYFALHPPASGAEFLEGGMLAIVYALMGLLAWYLVSQLRSNQRQLSGTLADLQTARAQLISEEKLAAVGRLASGIAHEIRNPVAMIVSALSTATDGSTISGEREEMFGIASRQAGRLEALTNDFLTYAKPTIPNRSPVHLGDLLASVVSVSRVRAAERGIQVMYRPEDDQEILVDASQIEGALLNLCLNAIDAIAGNGSVGITAVRGNGSLRIDVGNSGPAISAANMDRIFEPFFTTKAAGTGLGLAIARSVAKAHGGDLWVSRNENGNVIFTMTLDVQADRATEKEAAQWAGF
ncbi:MAG TPA: ATP-binding protein [Acidobacteriaceae bacterium]|nr:ATP-binding protein [Acidobacteriaceae bacterium]